MIESLFDCEEFIYMILPTNSNLSAFTINSYYLPWLISFFVATTLIVIILVIVIIICSSFKKKQKLLMIKSTSVVEGDIYIENANGNSFDKIKTDWVNTKSEDISYGNIRTNEKTKRYACFCCCTSRSETVQPSIDEGFGLLEPTNVVKVDLREKERHISVNHNHESIPDVSTATSDGMSDHETGRISHIDRELPPIPKTTHIDSNKANFNDSIVEPEIVSITESENYNELKQSDEPETDQQNFTSCNESTLSREHFELTSPSPTKMYKFQRSSTVYSTCCCGSHQDILSSDDLSSNDYDPTYAAIKHKKPSCPVCGVPSVYTPANSNRNSNLSLQFSSCVTSPIRNANLKPIDSSNNSTYASIAKLPKFLPDNNSNKEHDNSGSSTIKRQRSISQGDIVRTSALKAPLQSDIKIKDSHPSDTYTPSRNMLKNRSVITNPVIGTMSLWSLMASNRNSPCSMFPLIPERTYGQSVVDLIEKLRESEQLEKADKHSCFTLNDIGRSFTPPILFNNSFKKSGSIINSRGRVWTPPSCQMVHGNTYTKSGLCSPLKIFDRNSNSYDFNFPDIIGSYRKGNPLFQPILTPPLSPMDCLNSEKDETYEMSTSSCQQKEIYNGSKSLLEDNVNDSNNNNSVCQAASVYEDLDYENVIAADKEIEVINKEINLCIENSSDYDYLLNSDATEITDEIQVIGYSDDAVTSRTRPISIHLYGDESLTIEKSLKYRFDKCELFGFSSVQMSPLMEQSIENSSSKTTLSSLSFHQFNRLISSEDSCAKSPHSTEVSPSLDNFEISAETSTFLYNDLMWSKLNSAFDDYDTFE